MIVDHGNAPALHRFLEALPIAFVADPNNGIAPMPSHLFFQSFHQDLVSRTTHRIAFTPVQMVDPSPSHTAKPASGLDQDHLGTFFSRCQSCHDATGSTAIYADICLVTRNLRSQTVLPD